jgi:recombinational DNA repair protein (RecF pathway)
VRDWTTQNSTLKTHNSGLGYHERVPVIEDDALILDHHPFGDRHLVLAVLTHRYGVQRGVLRRARGGKAPTAVAAQIMSLVHVGLARKPEAELATFRHLDLVMSSFPLTRELARSAAAAVVSELLITYCPPAEPSERAFRLGVSCLEALLEETPADTVVAYAEFWILALGGVLPAGTTIAKELDRDDAGLLARFRNKAVKEVRTTVTPALSRWLDSQVRGEAERPLRALSFYRQTIGSDGAIGGSIR